MTVNVGSTYVITKHWWIRYFRGHIFTYPLVRHVTWPSHNICFVPFPAPWCFDFFFFFVPMIDCSSFAKTTAWTSLPLFSSTISTIYAKHFAVFKIDLNVHACCWPGFGSCFFLQKYIGIKASSESRHFQFVDAKYCNADLLMTCI